MLTSVSLHLDSLTEINASLWVPTCPYSSLSHSTHLQYHLDRFRYRHYTCWMLFLWDYSSVRPVTGLFDLLPYLQCRYGEWYSGNAAGSHWGPYFMHCSRGSQGREECDIQEHKLLRSYGLGEGSWGDGACLLKGNTFINSTLIWVKGRGWTKAQGEINKHSFHLRFARDFCNKGGREPSSTPGSISQKCVKVA